MAKLEMDVWQGRDKGNIYLSTDDVIVEVSKTRHTETWRTLNTWLRETERLQRLDEREASIAQFGRAGRG